MQHLLVEVAKQIMEIKIDLREMLKGSLLVDDPKVNFLYLDGKKTNEPSSVGYAILMPNNNYDKVVVKVMETEPSIQFSGTPLKVQFRNPSAKVYYDYKAQEIKVSMSAEGIELVPDNNPRLKVNKGIDE